MGDGERKTTVLETVHDEGEDFDVESSTSLAGKFSVSLTLRGKGRKPVILGEVVRFTRIFYGVAEVHYLCPECGASAVVDSDECPTSFPLSSDSWGFDVWGRFPELPLSCPVCLERWTAPAGQVWACCKSRCHVRNLPRDKNDPWAKKFSRLFSKSVWLGDDLKDVYSVK